MGSGFMKGMVIRMNRAKEKKTGRIFAAVLWLVLVLSLAGCRKDKGNETMENIEPKKGAVTAADVDDGPLTGDAVVMAVGKKAVTCKEAMFYLYQLKLMYQTALGEKLWSFEVEEGKTFEQYAKEEVVRQLTETKIISQEAEKQEIELSQDEKDEAWLCADEFCGAVPEEDKAVFGITPELVRSIYEENILADKMYNIATGSVNTNIPDEDARQIIIQYIKVLTNGTDKNGIKIAMTENQKSEAKKRAKKLLKEGKKEESFYSFAENNSDDSTVELTFGRDDMPAEFGEQAFELKEGEFSNVIEGETAYYILYCVSDYDEDATRRRKEEIIDKEQEEVFCNAYTQWSKGYEVVVSTPLWNQMKFD